MIGNFVRNYLIITVVLFLTDWFLPNVSFGYGVGANFDWSNFVTHLPTLLIAALVLTLLSLIARPILQILSAPINFVTLGLFNIVINVFLFWLATYLVADFTISALTIGGWQLNTFFSYVAVAAVFGLIQGFLALLL